MKTMKKLLYLMVGLVFAAACEKEPYEQDPDHEYLVYTEPAEDADFASFATFYLPDSILVMSSAQEPYYSTSYYATALLGEVRDNLKHCGYAQVADRSQADLGVRLTYLERMDRYFHYYDNPFWWAGYPGFWTPSYLRTANALVLELLDLSAATGSPTVYPIAWSAYLGGPASSSLYYDVQRMQDAIDQAFVQSPYLEQ
jgi:hypothetical protein